MFTLHNCTLFTYSVVKYRCEIYTAANSTLGSAWMTLKGQRADGGRRQFICSENNTAAPPLSSNQVSLRLCYKNTNEINSFRFVDHIH